LDNLWNADKKTLRKYMMEKRNSLISTQVQDYSQELFNKFLVSDLNNYESYMAYLPIRNETDTHKLIDYLLSMGKLVSVPFINEDNKIVPLMINKNTSYEKDTFSISIPKDKIIVSPENIDVIFVPGLAFDREGNRVGYGKGYYDNFLCNLKCITCAWCYDFQIIDRIPDISPNDVKIKRFL
jgi:5-formyltetrahydrofolate cyclo-ligase